MLRLTLEIVPHGIESLARSLGTLTLVNDGTGDAYYGNYDITLTPTEETQGEDLPSRGRVWGWLRESRGAWDLVYCAIRNLLGKRNEYPAGAGRHLYIRRENGRYQAVKEFTGFPADGIWLVKSSREGAGVEWTWIGELPVDAAKTHALLRQHQQAATRAVSDLLTKTYEESYRTNAQGEIVSWAYPSAFAIAKAALDAVAQAAEEGEHSS